MINSEPPSQATLDQAQARFDQQFQKCMGGKYLGPGGQVPSGFDSLEEFCRANSGPYVDNAGMQLRDLGEIVQGIATFVILLGALLGASLGGADWTNDTMKTLLTWEPRRIRVFLTRALVVVLVVAAVTIFLQAVFAAIFWVGASTRGMTAFAPSSLWSDVSQTILRTSVVAIAFGLIAYVDRHDRSLDGVVAGRVGRLPDPGGGGHRRVPALDRGVAPRARRHRDRRAGPDPATTARAAGSFSSGDVQVVMSVARANVVVGAYVLVLAVLALVVFRRRDVS